MLLNHGLKSIKTSTSFLAASFPLKSAKVLTTPREEESISIQTISDLSTIERLGATSSGRGKLAPATIWPSYLIGPHFADYQSTVEQESVQVARNTVFTEFGEFSLVIFTVFTELF